jgi:hypothetical protein
MRYRHTGNVHKDFHLATQTTIRYILDTYDRAFLAELFRRTAQEVYREIYRALVEGDAEPLVEHWSYYYERETGEFAVDRDADGSISFRVANCPAVSHIIERTGDVDETFYLQFELLAAGLSEGTPFEIAFERTGRTSYVYRIKRLDGKRTDNA